MRGRCLNHLTNGPSSEQTALHSLPASPKARTTPLLLLSNSNSLRWTSSWFGRGCVWGEIRSISFPPLARTPYPLLPSPPSSANASLVCLGVLREQGTTGMRSRTLKTEQRNTRAFQAACIFLRRSSPRAISTGQLHTLLHFHLRPINQVVFLGPYPLSR